MPYEVLEKAMNVDIDSHKDDSAQKIDWINILAILACKYSGDFTKYKASDIHEICALLSSGQSLSDITKTMENYAYYSQAYKAVLSEFLGYFSEEHEDSGGKREKTFTYGLKAFSPIADGFYYSHYDDFGASRTYGYKRLHLGHDLMAAVGTPVLAVESGIIEAIGWNRYGGWRIGIRSFDSKRYYYYAHLRQNRPYHADIYKGKEVKAGDVIGYVGRTGYSSTENTNGIECSHLHFGMQLIFDESQKEGNNEIWINLYELTKLLEQHKSKTYRRNETKEFYRKYTFEEFTNQIDPTKCN